MRQGGIGNWTEVGLAVEIDAAAFFRDGAVFSKSLKLKNLDKNPNFHAIQSFNLLDFTCHPT